ncbi:amine oxidase [Chlorella sorokiniana]|uniref:Amine oxidase n=1 Tax=Chlorella sorokiniana TaxID=3076 RepID=A0A2P6TWP7_CHLSO|nr:amine oxidase [Chlorella sorokiniana]|eukprot:PRW58489.1 amine oxidase [Chlorella sorokiniana]
MSGIALARNLTDAGYRVLVLEGRDRVGGRLNSTTTVAPGSHVDLGAMWIHDGIAGRNPLYDLVVSLGLKVSPRQDYGSIATFSYTGQRTNRSSFGRMFSSWYSQLQPALARLKGATPADNRSFGDVYGEWLAANTQFTAADRGQANMMMNTNYQSLLNGNVTQLSVARLGDAKSIPAVDVMLKDGFPALVDALVAKGGLDIRKNTVVTSVQQDGDGVIVATADGTNYTAPYVVMTQTLGTLKAGDIVFDPELPPEKLQAIEEMGFGVLDKALFVFDKPFWDTSVDFLLREMPDWSGRWSIFLNYHKLFGWPILAAIHVADTARELEKLTDEQVIGEGMAVLRQLYPGAPQPVQTAFTRWAAEPLSRGAYSYFAVGNPKNITRTLAQPHGRVLFAGEATSDKPATVLGAYLSGLREAERLRTLLGKPTGTSA